MTDLRQVVDDYLRLRRSLGHQMAEAAYLLPDFVSYMDDRGGQTVTIAAALDWVKTREPEVPAPSPTGSASPKQNDATEGAVRPVSPDSKEGSAVPREAGSKCRWAARGWRAADPSSMSR